MNPTRTSSGMTRGAMDKDQDEEDRRVLPHGRRAHDYWAVWDKRVRDGVLFVVGIAGIINELFVVAGPRPSALLFLGSLVGLPFVLQADERRRKDGDAGDQ